MDPHGVQSEGIQRRLCVTSYLLGFAFKANFFHFVANVPVFLIALFIPNMSRMNNLLRKSVFE